MHRSNSGHSSDTEADRTAELHERSDACKKEAAERARANLKAAIIAQKKQNKMLGRLEEYALFC